MRSLALSLVLILAGLTAAFAVEIEDRRVFGPQNGGDTLRVISTTDTGLFAPLIDAFRQENPTVTVDYTVVSSADLFRAVSGGGAPYDIALSSAMDLQTKLANDGFTRPFSEPVAELLPDWANWRGQVFAFTQEPATIVVSPSAFTGLDIPRSRKDLITLLREHEDRFRGRVGTYDIRQSGLGYLFATQDARSSETFWRLTEVMGHLGARLYCCSSSMIDDVATGRIAVAYNVLGSYAAARVAARDPIEIVEPEDFTTVMLRSAVLPAASTAPQLGDRFLRFLLEASWGARRVDAYPFPRPADIGAPQGRTLRPIRLGPGLLVFLDKFKRAQFLREWEDAILR